MKCTNCITKTRSEYLRQRSFRADGGLMALKRSHPIKTIALLLLILVLQSFAFSQAAATESLTSFQTLYSFRGGTDGIGPNGVVLDKAGNLYGTTAAGGETSCPLNGRPGCGVVFRLNGE